MVNKGIQAVVEEKKVEIVKVFRETQTDEFTVEEQVVLFFTLPHAPFWWVRDSFSGYLYLFYFERKISYLLK